MGKRPERAENHDAEEDSDQQDDLSLESLGEKDESEDDHDQEVDEEGDDAEDDERANDAALACSKNAKKVHRLSMKKTQDFNETLKSRGVIYVARIPPRMTPTKLRTILSDFGEVTRVFCQEEDAAKRKRRRKANGGSGSKRYVEGWVEFADKKVAKRVAAALHQHPISSIKRNPHYGDLWNLKYLSKFQWSHLTEKVAYERRVREQKLRLETMQAKRESASYKKLLESGVKLDQIAERKRKRDGSATADDKDTKKSSSFQIKSLDEGAHQASNAAILKSLL
jgi:ESF2/ABP1 family protein